MQRKAWCSGLAVSGLLLLAACSGPVPRPDEPVAGQGATTKPGAVQKRGGGYYKDDGPGDEIPTHLDEIPDAVPRAEPLHRFANRPYNVLGKSYTPYTSLKPYRKSGVASWYGKKFHGQKTSIGEVYDMFAMTAAHPTLAIPSYARVRNPANGRAVVVRVIDRGPFHADRIIDLSYAAAYRLGYINKGSTLVEVESILPGDEIPTEPPAEAIYVQASQPAPVEKSLESAGGIDEIERLAGRLQASGPVDAPVSEMVDTAGIYLQLGAFSSADNADNLRIHLSRELDWLAEGIQVNAGDGIYRVHLGPYASRSAAERVADRIRLALGYSPTFVTR